MAFRLRNQLRLGGMLLALSFLPVTLSHAQTGQESASQAKLPALILVPVDAADRESRANPCWVRFYEDPDFKGRQITLFGPQFIPRLGAIYVPYEGGYSSAVVGPRARVQIFDGALYENRAATLKSGEHVRSLDDEKLGLFEDIESIRVNCTS